MHWLVLILISRANSARGECSLVWSCSVATTVIMVWMWIKKSGDGTMAHSITIVAVTSGGSSDFGRERIVNCDGVGRWWLIWIIYDRFHEFGLSHALFITMLVGTGVWQLLLCDF